MTRKPNRSPMDELTDMAAAAIYGTAMGIEAQFGGNIGATAASLDKALVLLLEDIEREAGPLTASRVAHRLMETLVCYTEDGVEVKEEKKN